MIDRRLQDSGLLGWWRMLSSVMQIKMGHRDFRAPYKYKFTARFIIPTEFVKGWIGYEW